jgi:hypothetical protein
VDGAADQDGAGGSGGEEKEFASRVHNQVMARCGAAFKSGFCDAGRRGLEGFG